MKTAERIVDILLLVAAVTTLWLAGNGYRTGATVSAAICAGFALIRLGFMR